MECWDYHILVMHTAVDALDEADEKPESAGGSGNISGQCAGLSG